MNTRPETKRRFWICLNCGLADGPRCAKCGSTDVKRYVLAPRPTPPDTGHHEHHFHFLTHQCPCGATKSGNKTGRVFSDPTNLPKGWRP